MNYKLNQKLMLIVVLLICIAGISTVFAAPPKDFFIGTDDVNNVKAAYNGTDELTITLQNVNTDTIDRAKWLSMVDEITGGFYYWSQKDIDITFDIQDDQTLYLPADASNFFTLLYGNITGIDKVNTSKVTTMQAMFQGAEAFNSPLTGWDTSKVTSMHSMFSGAKAFNQMLNFDTSQVTSMFSMFDGATAFNQRLHFNNADWNTEKVRSTANMFKKASSFNQAINWNTKFVTNMSSMFNGASAFNQELNLNTSIVRNMSRMFKDATAFNQPLKWNNSNWTTSSVRNMSSMFENAESFNQPLEWATHNVNTMEKMFYNAEAFNQPLNWSTKRVTTMEKMFENARVFNQPLDWNINNVTTTDSMFKEALAFNQPLNWSSQSLKNADKMFLATTGLKQMIKLNAPVLESAKSIFLASSVRGLELDTLNTTKTDLDEGLYNCPNLAYLKIKGVKNAALDYKRSNGHLVATLFYINSGNNIQLNRNQLFADDYKILLVDDGVSITQNKDAFFIFDDNKNEYEISLVTKPDLSNVTVDAIDDQIYTGNPIVPILSVSDNGYILQPNVDYTISEQLNNVNEGQASLKLTALEKIYTGEKTVTFNIVNINVSLADLKAEHQAGLTSTHTLQVSDFPAGTSVIQSIVTDFTDNASILSSTFTATTSGGITYTLSGNGAAGDIATAKVSFQIKENGIDKIATANVEVKLTEASNGGGSGGSGGGSGGGTGGGSGGTGGGSGGSGGSSGGGSGGDTGGGTGGDTGGGTGGGSTVPTPPANTVIIGKTPTPAGPVENAELLKKKAEENNYKVTSELVDKKAKEEISFKVPADATCPKKYAIYVYNEETGTWQYLGGKLKDGNVVLEAPKDGVYALMLYNKQFSDVSENYSWARKAIEVLASHHIVNGVDDTHFNPSASVTREQFAVLLQRALKFETVNEKTFTDLNDWSKDAIETLAGLDIIKGYGDEFKPNKEIKREEMVAMIYRALKATKIAYEAPNTSAPVFEDEDAISDWAKDAVKEASKLNLVKGDGNLFKPKDTTTRAETAVVIYRLLQLLNKM